VEVPPLRDRKEDIPLLVNDFIKKCAKQSSRKIEKISNEAISLLMDYDWQGNIRELENVIERAVILGKGQIITPEDLPEFLNAAALSKEEGSAGDNGDKLKLKDALKHPEKDLILKALNSANWKRNEAANILGINRTTLFKKMRKYGLLKNHCEDK